MNKSLITFLSASLCAVGMMAGPALTNDVAVVNVDSSVVIGPMKDINGVGQPPMYTRIDVKMFKYLKEAHIPFSRLHDVGGAFGGNVYVDIPNIFRDFDADENDPDNYDFAFTDIIVKGLVDYGVRPFYRLGVTIENFHTVGAYRVYPPKDFAKWARICEHIIAHYNEGWAKGYKLGITEWEIWNEADLGGAMWKGSYGQYCDLYVTAAKHLKARFPDISVGGPACCGPHHMKQIQQFLDAVKKENAPLDFFSFHSYSKLSEALEQIETVKKTLEENGFKDMETNLNEYMFKDNGGYVGTLEQASGFAAGLIALQNSPLKKAAIYDARCRTGVYSSLFSGETRSPRIGYYAFRAYGDLKALGTQVKAASSNDGLKVIAASDGKKTALMMVNRTAAPMPFKLDFPLGNKHSWLVINSAVKYLAPAKEPTSVCPYGIYVLVVE